MARAPQRLMPAESGKYQVFVARVIKQPAVFCLKFLYAASAERLVPLRGRSEGRWVSCLPTPHRRL